MQILKSKSLNYPKPLIIEPRMIDVNEDVVEETTKDEGGNEHIQYSYTTYRFRNYAEYTAWLNERKDATIQEQQDHIDLLEGCIMELTGIISDLMYAMEE